MHRFITLLAVVAFVPFTAMGQDKRPKSEYAEFSKLVHSVVVKQLPKEFEDASGWGGRTEIPDDLPLMGLRKVVKVGDKLEAPHGPWYRFKGRIEDPAKNLKIDVKDFKKLSLTSYRVVADVDLVITGQVDFQQWQKGIMLVGTDVIGDANLTAAIVIDVEASLNFKKIPPALDLTPKVAELGLNLVDFRVRGGPILKKDRGKLLTAQFKDVVRLMVKASEPMVKDLANQAIVESLKEGKGTISADAIMKTLPKEKK